MADRRPVFHRRRFIRTAIQSVQRSCAPVHSRSDPGQDGATPPSERIVVGGIGIGDRGTYDLGCFLEEPDVRFVAVCDVKAARRRGGQEKGR